MKVDDIDIGFVHFGESLHPSHRGFAEAVGADVLHCGRNAPIANPLGEVLGGFLGFPDEYDLLISEGTRPLIALSASRLVDDTPVVYLGGDAALHQLNTGIQGGTTPYDYVKLTAGRYGSRVINSIFASTVDGVIGVSNFANDLIRKYLGDNIPYRTAYPYIQPDVYRELESITPTLSKPSAITIGQHADYKNVDCLVNGWPKVRDAHPAATLRVVGSGHPEWYDDVPGVKRMGYVSNLGEPLSQSALYIHPALAEVFGVAVVEAMLAGVPAMVTTMTGAKEASGKVKDDLIIEPTESALTSSIIKYFNRLPHNNLSIDSRKVARSFDESRRKQKFVRVLNGLLIEIEKLDTG